MLVIKDDQIANFKTHVNGAIVAGIIGEALTIPFGTTSIRYTIGYLIIAILGALLPDIDSSSSHSKNIIFNILAVIGIYFYSMRFDAINSFQSLIEVFMIYFGIRFGLSALLSKHCIHRGIFHSIPLMFIWAFIGALISSRMLDFNPTQSWTVAFIISLGFLSHLVLDECYSVNLVGLKLKKSFGSAFKFKGVTRRSTISVYMLMAFLLNLMPPFYTFKLLLLSNTYSYWQYFKYLLFYLNIS